MAVVDASTAISLLLQPHFHVYAHCTICMLNRSLNEQLDALLKVMLRTYFDLEFLMYALPVNDSTEWFFFEALQTVREPEGKQKNTNAHTFLLAHLLTFLNHSLSCSCSFIESTRSYIHVW